MADVAAVVTVAVAAAILVFFADWELAVLWLLEVGDTTLALCEADAEVLVDADVLADCELLSEAEA